MFPSTAHQVIPDVLIRKPITANLLEAQRPPRHLPSCLNSHFHAQNLLDGVLRDYVLFLRATRDGMS